MSAEIGRDTVQVGLGCVRLGGGDGRSVADDVRLVEGAIDLGITIFDTADVYGGGASEHVLGKAIGKRRDEVQIATKAGFVFRPRHPVEQWARRRAKPFIGRIRDCRSAGGSTSSEGAGNYAAHDFSARHLRAAVHDSLRRLQTDRIDVFQLHGPDAAVPAVIAQLADLVTAGDIVRIGVGADSVQAARDWLDTSGVSVLQVPFGVLDPASATDVFPDAAAAGQDVWVRGVLGGGLLGLDGASPALADHPKRAQIQRLRSVASEAGLDIHRFALRYAGAHADSFAAALVGSTSLEHLAQNVRDLTGPTLSNDLVAAANLIGTETADAARPLP